MTTSRASWRLTEAELRAWLDALVAAGNRVIAPVAEDGLRALRPVANANAVCLLPGTTRWSAKEHLFPRTETLYSYSFGGEGIRLDDPPADDRPQVLFAVPCCDAAGLVRLDALLGSSPEDPFYGRRRRLTTVVSLACTEAAPACFCTAVGGSPAGTDGSDLQLVPVGDAWLLRELTTEGEALAKPQRHEWNEATPAQLEKADEQRRRVEVAMSRSPIPHDAATRLEEGFGDPVWRRLAETCLGCSICAYVCPTCSCFDINHDGNAWGGAQRRSWDSCTFALFTRHASGHNPRPTEAERYRQRVLHKFAYRSAHGDPAFRCVGCGRCIELCPVGLDIHAAVSRVLAISRERARPARGGA